MSLVTASSTLPSPALAAPAAKPPASASPPMPMPTPAAPSPAKPAPVPSTTVTLSPQAQSALAAMPATDDGSIYESLKNGISTAVGDVGDAIAGGAHAVVDGVETTLSTAHDMAKGLLGLPFAAVAKVCDAAGAIVDKL